MTTCRHNFHEDCEKALNKQINMELYASHVYLSMGSHFEHPDIDLPNVAKYFYDASLEEKQHAQILISYVNKRGGRVTINDIAKPNHNLTSLVVAFELALLLETDVNTSLLYLHKLAEEHHDAHLTDTLEGTFLNEQVDAMREIHGHITNIKRCMQSNGDGLGEYIFDKNFLGKA